MRTQYLYDDVTGACIAEFDENGDTQVEYTTNPQTVELISENHNGQEVYHRYDGDGNTRQTADSAGSVLGEATYSAFGETVAESGDMQTIYRFRGQQGFSTDPVTGDVSRGIQSYAPSLGRRLSLASRMSRISNRGYSAATRSMPQQAGWQISIASIDLKAACSTDHDARLVFSFPANSLPTPKPVQVWQLVYSRMYILMSGTCKWILREGMAFDVFSYEVRDGVVQVEDARAVIPLGGSGFGRACMIYEETEASVGFNPLDAAGRNVILPGPRTYYDEQITNAMIASAAQRRLVSPVFRTTYMAIDKARCRTCFPSCLLRWFPPSNCRECFHLNGDGGCGASGPVAIGGGTSTPRGSDLPRTTDTPPAPRPRPTVIPPIVSEKPPYYDF